MSLKLRDERSLQWRRHARGDTIPAADGTHPPWGALGGGARGAERRSPHEVWSALLPAMQVPSWLAPRARRPVRPTADAVHSHGERRVTADFFGRARGGERAVAMGGRSRVLTQTPGDDRPVSRHRNCRAARPVNRMRTGP